MYIIYWNSFALITHTITQGQPRLALTAVHQGPYRRAGGSGAGGQTGSAEKQPRLGGGDGRPLLEQEQQLLKVLTRVRSV